MVELSKTTPPSGTEESYYEICVNQKFIVSGNTGSKT